MSMMSGTVYVARGRGGSASKAAEGMAKGFRDGLPVVFFPEGTTGVGDEIAMPFRSGLLAQAIEAEAPIVPAFITYALCAQDIAAGKTLRNDVHWGARGPARPDLELPFAAWAARHHTVRRRSNRFQRGCHRQPQSGCRRSPSGRHSSQRSPRILAGASRLKFVARKNMRKISI